jgi:hypothetical protein
MWISGAVSDLSMRPPIRRARDLADYYAPIQKILALNAEGYSGAQIVRP